MNEPTWESHCHRCGICCFEKLEYEDGTIFFTQTACSYLDITTMECSIYDRRFEINPECIQLNPELIKELNWLHDDCGYRKALGITRKKKRRKSSPA